MTAVVQQARDAFSRSLQQQLKLLKSLDVVNDDDDFVEAVHILYRPGRPQKEIADLLEVVPGTISRWFNGERLPIKRSVREMYHGLMVRAMEKLISAAVAD